MDFFIAMHDYYLDLTHEAMQELLESTTSTPRRTPIIPPIYQVKDANGTIIAFPISMEIRTVENTNCEDGNKESLGVSLPDND